MQNESRALTHLPFMRDILKANSLRQTLFLLADSRILLLRDAGNTGAFLVRSTLLVFFLQCLVSAQVPHQSRPSTPPHKTVAGQEPQAISQEHLNRIENQNSAIEGHLAEIEKTIADLKHSSLLTVLLPALVAALSGLGGVFIGGLINERLQRERLTQEREVFEQQAKLRIGDAVIEWELKQLSLLYGPVRALLGQSFGLYRQMNKVLEAADSRSFRFAKLGGGLDAQEFQIKTASGTWERFRTVMHISEVYGKGLGVETYFDEIVSIGARIVTIIEQQAGYARPQEKELMTVFAKYLAHFAVLKHLHGEAQQTIASKAAREKTTVQVSAEPTMKVDVSAVFPEELHTLIDNGFDAITNDIEEWRRKAGA